MILTSTIGISLTDFIDFAMMSGSKKLTKVKQIKNRGDYGYEKDYYAPLRESIQRMHRQGEHKKSLEDILTDELHESKRKNYPDMIRGYQKFLGRKNTDWQKPPRAVWQHEELAVKLNPELYLLVDDEPTVIKMHFRKDEQLSKDKICSIIHLMENEMAKLVDNQAIFGVLDVKRGKLFTDDKRKNNLMPLIEAEAKSFISLYQQSL